MVTGFLTLRSCQFSLLPGLKKKIHLSRCGVCVFNLYHIQGSVFTETRVKPRVFSFCLFILLMPKDILKCGKALKFILRVNLLFSKPLCVHFIRMYFKNWHLLRCHGEPWKYINKAWIQFAFTWLEWHLANWNREEEEKKHFGHHQWP